MQYSGIAHKAQHTQRAGLFLFDLDGTIIAKGSSRVSEATLGAMEDARDAGWALAVCSGRCWGLMPRQLVRRGVMDYYICSNGSTVLDGGGRPLHREAMPAGQCRSVMATVADLRPGWNCFTGPRAYAQARAASYMMASASPEAGGPSMGVLSRGVSTARLVFGGVGFRYMPSVEWVLGRWPHGLEKMGASFADGATRDEATRRLVARGDLEVVGMGATEIEITRSGATKGTGVDWLVDHLGLDRGRAIAFGDSENDPPLLGHVGRLVGMGNSTPAMAAVADELTGRIEEEGVATWLERFLWERAVR